MKLGPEHEAMLAGEAGKALASAMNTLVDYGKAFGAIKMVPIKSSHLAGFSLRIGNKKLLTPSGKLYYYLSDSFYGTVKDFLKTCGV